MNSCGYQGRKDLSSQSASFDDNVGSKLKWACRGKNINLPSVHLTSAIVAGAVVYKVFFFELSDNFALGFSRGFFISL